MAEGKSRKDQDSSGSVPDGFEHAAPPFPYRLHLAYPGCFAIRVKEDDADSKWKSGDILIVEPTNKAPFGALVVANGTVIRNECSKGVTGKVVSMLRKISA